MARDANVMLRRVTDPAKFLRPASAIGFDKFEEHATTIDQALDNMLVVTDGNKNPIGTTSPDYQLMLSSKIRSLMDVLKRVPLKEEALAHLLYDAHRDWDIDQLVTLGAKDKSADLTLLRRYITRLIDKSAAKPKPAPKPAPEKEVPVVAEPPKTKEKKMTNPQTTIIVSTAMGKLRIPVAESIITDDLIILVQQGDSFGWSPSDTDTLFTFTIDADELQVTWSGIAYTNAAGMIHTVFIREP